MNLANNLTILRVLLAPVFVTCLAYAAPPREGLLWAAAGVFAFACVTDALDGWVARRFRQETAFGGYVDPLADKLLLVSGFVSLSLMPHLAESARIPAWVAIPVITRDFVILGGSATIFLVTGSLKARPLLVSKATTFFQMLTLAAALVGAPPEPRHLLHLVTVALTAVSGVWYILLGSRILSEGS